MAKSKPNFDHELSGLRPGLVEVFEVLRHKGAAHWYPSLWVERRQNQSFNFNDKEQSFSVGLKEGVVLRIYDGETLHEEACDQLDVPFLKKRATEFVNRVRKVAAPSPARPYSPPSWPERQQSELAAAITEQIPEQVDATTWVHFATSCAIPLWNQQSEVMGFGQEVFKRLQDFKFSLPDDHSAKNPDFSQVRLSLQRDDFLFIDEKVRMTQTLLRNYVRSMVVNGGEAGVVVQGGLGGQESLSFTDEHVAETYEHLKNALDAERLEPGRYKLLMAPAITGVFAHEAFGHSQEGDTWARGRSRARDLYESQESVGNEHATILNNPAIYENGTDDFAAWGSYFFDEEGWLAEEHYLVKSGQLQRPMTNLTSAIRLGVPRTANGKRESWTNGIYTRQTNTYFSAGEMTLSELMAMVDYGFLARMCNGGMEDPKGMGIQVGIAYLEEIKDGQLTGRTFKGPNGGALQMTGYVPEYLNAILGKSKIEHDCAEADSVKHPWNDVGGCGKYHKEAVNAGCGGPYMLVDQVLLG